jgi:predicted nucleic acid-binding protein
MMLYYLDSSAWAKRYFQETGSEAVEVLFEQTPVMACSPLGLIEVGSTMARKRSAGEMTPDEFEAKRASLLKDWQRFLQIDVIPSVVLRAFDASGAYGLRGADSLHLASALALKEQLEPDSGEFALVTSDRELKTAALKAGLAVVDPQEQGKRPAESRSPTHRSPR